MSDPRSRDPFLCRVVHAAMRSPRFCRAVAAARRRPERPASDLMALYLAGELALRLHPVRACASPAEVRQWREEHEEVVERLWEEVRRVA